MSRVRRAVRRRVERLRGRPAREEAQVAQPAPPPPPVPGMVEEFTRRRVVGWVSVPADTDEVRVDLVLNNLVVASTIATPNESLSSADSLVRRGLVTDPAAESTDRHPPIQGPDDDRRNTRQQLRTFAFRVRGIWDYAHRATRISLRVNGQPLPIYRHGMFLHPRANGEHLVRELRALLEQGYVLDGSGRISLVRDLDAPWQSAVMQLHGRVRKLLAEELGLDVFLMYGSLLGAVREGGPIGHDNDFDIAYVSRHRQGELAAAELEQVALLLIHHGFAVECHRSALHLADPADPDHRIDLFHTYFDEAGELALPFGAAGSSAFPEEDWRGLEPTVFMGHDAAVPVAAEQLLAHLYGDDWRTPKQGFNWRLDRTRWAEAGRLSVAQQTRMHWADFYSRHHFDSGSTFSRFVLDRPGTPARLVDLGCGDGRDACALAAAGRTVLGVDASEEGVAHAALRAEGLGLDSRLSFVACDVSDAESLRSHLEPFVAAADGPVGFYLRFFLHAIPEDAQARLLQTLDAVARPGDQLLAEFRTTGDAAIRKVHGKHFRRYLDASAFAAELSTTYRFEVEHLEEGQGLSPFGEEDPVLCRIVATRTA
jgi:SAM-dependent methyltransferase